MQQAGSVAVVLLLGLPAYGAAQQLRRASINPTPIAAGQKCPNWCWAAGAEMLLRSQRINIPQEQLVERVWGPTRPCRPTFGSFEPIRQAVSGTWKTAAGKTVHIVGAYHYGIPTNPAGMIQSIQSGRPFLLAFGGHIYVAYELSWYEQPYLRIVELRLIDPLFPYGRSKYVRYGFEDGGSQINGTFELLVMK
jgi:hypothetical protein